MDILLLPVDTHVLKYLKFHQEEEHYFLSESDIFGLFLFRLLREEPVDRRRDAGLAGYTTEWEVNMGSYGADSWGLRAPTSKAVYLFNSFVHKFILKEMHGYVEQALDHRQQAKYAIEGFMLKYGFREEDIQFATLQKSWTRYWSGRKSKKKKPVSLTGRLPLRELEKRLVNLAPHLEKAA